MAIQYGALYRGVDYSTDLKEAVLWISLSGAVPVAWAR